MRRAGLSTVGFALAVLIIACDQKEAAPSPRGPLPLVGMSPFGNEVYPLANGDAYLINQYDKQLFYLSEGVAVRVHGVDVQGLDPTIYPAANGAAYLACAYDSNLRLYYLVGDRAIEVKEAAQRPATQSLAAPSREGFLWAQAQSAHMRYQRQKRDTEDDQPADEPERDLP